MTGTVSDEGVPIIMVLVAGQMWPGIIVIPVSMGM
jgi:hypothetical protein